MPGTRTRLALPLFVVSALCALIASCQSNGGQITLSGAGSTFIYPAMGHWIEDFGQMHPGFRVNYQSIGSGGGIQQIRAGTVDFGASDTPLRDQELKTMPPVLQIAESAGPVCITYNLPGAKQPLRLSSKTLAAIFLGEIKSWRDPMLLQDNPRSDLPQLPLTVVHRADGSGTTNAFTSYLSAVSPVWAAKVGSGKSVSWPTGLGGKGNEGVAGAMELSPGALGYVELAFAVENQLPVAAIQNQAGHYVPPSTAGTTAAVDAFQSRLAQDARTPIVNPPASAPDAYPISTLTFLIIPKDGRNAPARSALKKFVQYIVTDGQQAAARLGYAPLPSVLAQQDMTILNQMTTDGKPTE